MKEQYIKDINELLPLADLEWLDYVYQLLKKTIPNPQIISSAEESQSV